MQPDVYAVQGYDAAQMLGVGLAAVKGDTARKAEFAVMVVRETGLEPVSPCGRLILSQLRKPFRHSRMSHIMHTRQFSPQGIVLCV